MLHRLLDEGVPDEVRHDITLLTAAHTAGVACYRYSPVFLATISRGLHVSLDELGIAMAVSELSGLTSPLLGRVVDRVGRRSALAGAQLVMAAAALLAAASTGSVVFTLALVLLCQSRIVYDLGLGSWISDHVAYARRSRIVGLTEISWALGLLVGVTVMALVTALASWRWAYATVAAVIMVTATSIGRRVDPGTDAPTAPTAAPSGSGARRLTRRGWLLTGAALMLMGGMQALFVTFGSWLEDTFDIGALGLGAVTVVLGLGELCAPLLSARRTDRWGKERSVALGAGLTVAGALALSIAHDHLAIGLALFVLTIAGFEFAVVSLIATGAQLVPGAPGRGLGMIVGAGTLGRAMVAIPATHLYDGGGIGGPALMTAAFGTFAVVAVVRAGAEGGQPR